MEPAPFSIRPALKRLISLTERAHGSTGHVLEPTDQRYRFACSGVGERSTGREGGEGGGKRGLAPPPSEARGLLMVGTAPSQCRLLPTNNHTSQTWTPTTRPFSRQTSRSDLYLCGWDTNRPSRTVASGARTPSRTEPMGTMVVRPSTLTASASGKTHTSASYRMVSTDCIPHVMATSARPWCRR